MRYYFPSTQFELSVPSFFFSFNILTLLLNDGRPSGHDQEVETNITRSKYYTASEAGKKIHLIFLLIDHV